MKHTVFKRLLSALLSLAMVLSVVAMPVLAEGADAVIYYDNSESLWAQVFVSWADADGSEVAEIFDGDGDGLYEALIPGGSSLVTFGPSAEISEHPLWLTSVTAGEVYRYAPPAEEPEEEPIEEPVEEEPVDEPIDEELVEEEPVEEEPVHGHDYVSTVTDPTCTEQGYTTYTCTCGDSFVESFTDALGHDYVDGVCSVCGEAEAAVQAEEDLLASGTCGSSLTWTLSTDGVLTISGQGSMPNNGSSSAYEWNSYYTSVTAVVIESGVTGIGDHAFEGCYNMTSITIPEGVASIGTYAFSGCEKLAGITLPAGVTGIGDFAFWYCESLAYITLPGSLSSIGEGAFFGCRSLTNISIPAGVTAIADHTFNDCQSLTGVTLPDSLTDIGDHAFFCCYQLTDITIPAGVTGIGDHTFEQCFALTSVNIPNGVSGIGEQAFYGCRSLTTVTIPSGVTGVGAKAFYGCSNLTTVTIPASVTGIGTDAFYACSSIEDVFYGGTADQWSSLSNTPSAPYIHYSCTGWETVTTEPTCTEAGSSKEVCACGYERNAAELEAAGHKYTDGVCSVCGAVELIASGSCGTDLTWELDAKGVLTVSGQGDMPYGASAPSYYDWYTYRPSITSVVIDRGVTSIGNYAFANTSSLTSVTIPDSVTSIGEWAFSECFGLKSISLPDSVTSIGEFAFEGCSSLTSITIPKGVTSIAPSAFRTCQGLTSVTIPDSISSIGSYAFEFCTALTSITIPDSVTSIGSYAFYGCRSLTTVTIPSGVTGVGAKTFYGCSNLTTVTIPDSVVSIGDYAFWGCSKLTCITLPASVTGIGSGAFHNCTGIAAVFYRGTEAQEADITIGSENTALTSAAWHYEVTEETHDGQPCYRCGKCGLLYAPDGTQIPEGWTLENGVLTIFGNGPMEDYSSGTEAPWYPQRSEITYVVITDGVTGIGNYAFASTSSLTSITIPDSVTSIGEWAFSGCSSLTTINIPDSVTSIGEWAFTSCDSLTTINIPDSVTSIGEFAFESCSSLTSITIPKGVTSIAPSAFRSCSALTSVTIPDSVTSIGSYAFYGCYRLTSINIPDSVTSIGEYAFSGCSGFTSITIPDGVTSIAPSAFRSCSALTSVTIPDSVTSIGEYAFYDCSNLSGITIPSSVTSIGSSAFEYCSSLTSITIPDSVTSIGSSAFYRCSNIEDVFYSGTADQWTALTNRPEADFVHYSCVSSEGHWQTLTTEPTCTATGSTKEVCACGYERNIVETEPAGHKYVDGVCSVCGAVELIASGTCGTDLTWELDTKGVLTISGEGPMEDYASESDVPWYSRRAEITDLVIGDGVTAIGNFAFSKCSSLMSITIPDSVTTIGNYAFYDCSSLNSITIPGSVTGIGDGAFRDCSSLNSITIPDNVTSIGEYTFEDCASLTSVTVGDRLASIGWGAFSYCRNLTDIILPDSVTSIASNAFYNCSGLKQITIPNGVTGIESYTFYGCSSLTSITLPDSITGIATGAFRSCSSLESIIIPDSITSIVDYTFHGCTNLTSITIPDSVTNIGSYTFQDCSSLTTVFYKGTEAQKANIKIGSSNDPFTSAAWHYEVTEEVRDGQLCYRCGKCGLLYAADGALIPEEITDRVTVTIIGNSGEYVYDGSEKTVSGYVIDISDPRYTKADFRFSGDATVNGTNVGIYDMALTPEDFVNTNERFTNVAFVIVDGRLSITPKALTITADSAEKIYDAAVLSKDSFTDTGLAEGDSFGDLTVTGSQTVVGISVNAVSDAVIVNTNGEDVTYNYAITYVDGTLTVTHKELTITADSAEKVYDGSALTKDSFTHSGLAEGDSFASVTVTGSQTVAGTSANVASDAVIVNTNGEDVTSSYIITYMDGTLEVTKAELIWTLVDGVLTISGNGPMEDYAAASDAPWYSQRTEITSVVIGDGVTSIGDNAFYGCTLRNVTVADSVTSIGSSAFDSCSDLTDITIPGSVTDIGNYAFYGCFALTDITIPNSVTGIGNAAFRECSSLTDIYITDLAAWLDICSAEGFFHPFGENLLAHTLHLNGEPITDLVIPDGVTTIAEEAFRYCTGLKSVTLPDTVTSIEANAFKGCSGLTSITMGGVSDIEAYAFDGCSELTDVYITDLTAWLDISATGLYAHPFEASTKAHRLYLNGEPITDLVIPDGVTAIGEKMFYYCTGITSVTIPDSVASIGEYTFGNCSGLSSVIIGSGVTNIEDNAFAACTKLFAAFYKGTEAQKSNISIGIYNFDLTYCNWHYEVEEEIWDGQLCYRCGKCGLLYAADGALIPEGPTWTLENGVLTISGNGPMENYAADTDVPWYSQRTSVTSVVIGEGITSIGDKAFFGCNLQTITVPDSVTSIGARAFFSCIYLTGITLPDGVTSIGDHAFYGCTSLADISMPDSVTSIGEYAFYMCSSLTDITLPKGITSISPSTFAICTGLTSIIIPEGVTSIGSYTFQGCSGLKSITVPDSVTEIGRSTFLSCSSLKSITIPDGITSIDSSMFSGCSSLSSITIPDSVTGIGSSAFKGCSSLTSITIPDSVTSIGSYAFQGCCSLTGVTLGNGVARIGSDAFLECTSLTDVYITDMAAWLNISFAGSNSHPFSALIEPHTLYLNGEAVTGLVIPDGVTAIPDHAFNGCAGITSVTIPDSVTVIGEYAFYDCSGITGIHIPESVTSIRFAAFEGCSGLKYINIPNAITEIDEWVFANCKGLTSITIPDSVTSIGDHAFRGCSMTSIIIPENVTSIGYAAFEGCYSLTSVTIPHGITEIGEWVFGTCPKLASVTIPDSVTSIGENAFTGCNSIEDVFYGGTADQWSSLSNSPTATYIHYSCMSGEGHWETVVNAPTCTEAGSSRDVCACGYARNIVETEAAGHTEIIDEKVEPTCTGTGLTEGKHCSVCNEVILAQEVIPANGHTEIIDARVESTCTETGLTEGKHCSVCGTVTLAQEVIPANGHSYVDGICDLCGESDPSALQAPTLSVSNVASTGKIKLTWNAVPGAVKYDVYRSTSKNGTYTLLKTATSTQLTNTSVTVGTTYYYYVEAVSEAGVKSARSNTVSRTCDLARPTVTVTNVASSGKPKVSWTAVTGATKYTLYIYDADGTLLKSTTTTGTALTHSSATVGTAYTYKVKALCDVSAATSAFSASKSCTCALARPTVTVTNVASSGKIKISWNAVSGATKYTLYIYDAEGTLLKTSNTTGTSLTHSSAAAGTTYTYEVRALCGVSAATSAFSEAKTRTCDLARPTVTVSNVAASGKIKISWAKVTGATKYTLYIYDAEGSLLKTSTTTGTALTHSSAAAGTAYTYKVKALCSVSAATSAFSEAKTRVCDLPRPNVSVALNSNGKPVLTWAKISGAAKYTVYIYDADGTLLKTSSTTGTKLTHASAAGGTAYSYRVVSVSSISGANSAMSAAVSAQAK